jgi:DNA polymerase-3 subunit gamma/tau
MSYQVLARKWRPRSFAEMVGQGHVLKALANALDSDRLHHAYLFTGTRGVGKTTLGRILAKCFNCERGPSSTPCGQCSACISIDEGRFVDLIEVDAASRAKVDETRDLMDNVQYLPTAGRFKVYLIDEVHMFSGHSFNALLKTLEEPPPHVKFLLATTEPKKLPVTILSRCLQFNLKHLTADQIAGQLTRIAAEEGIASDPGSIRLLAGAAAGSMRDALSLLDQAIAYGDGVLQQDQVREMLGTIDSTELAALLDCLARGDAQELLARAGRIAEHNPDYDAILGALQSSLHDIALTQALGSAPEGADPHCSDLAARMAPEEVQLNYQIALHGRRDLEFAPAAGIGFEMTLIRMLAFRPADAVMEPATGGGTAARTVRPLAAVQPAESAQTTVAGDSGKSTAPEEGAVASDRGSAPDSWQQIIDEMALAGLVKELAGHCVLKEHSADRVHLVLSPAQEHLLKTTQKERLQDAIRIRFGERVKLLISVDKPGAETPAERGTREARERQQAAEQTLETDPNVRSMMDMFDATLHRDSIRPRQQ